MRELPHHEYANHVHWLYEADWCCDMDAETDYWQDQD